MSDHHETPEQRSPQDAPADPAPSAPPRTTPLPTTAPPAPPRREVTHLPAAAGPNWGLVLSGLAFMVIAAGVILNQVNGFQVEELRQVGPTLLVAVGVGSALIGIIGLVTRRGR